MGPVERNQPLFLVGQLFFSVFLCFAGYAQARVLTADPNANSASPKYYRNLASQLKPGDTLRLPAGVYRERLDLSNLQGRSDAWSTILGPDSGAVAIITTTSTCCNIIQLGNTSFVAIKNLTIDSADIEGVDGINAKGGITHHILIENCTLIGQGQNQQTVGISTKSAAWNWIIRRNRIIKAGTGLYLGNSDGRFPFIAGIVESNLVVDTIGYNMQIKFQKPYALSSGMPAGPNKTIIRNNVFIKTIAQSEWQPLPDGSSRVSGARPNVLVGGFPDSGPGSQDLYEIYANFFYRNPDEALLQASGRSVVHDNIFVGASDAAMRFMNHDLPLKLAYVYNNTIYGGRYGIRFASSAVQGDAVVGNLVFADAPIGGFITKQSDNITGMVGDAANYVKSPSLVLGTMDFYPLPGKCQGDAIDLTLFAFNTDYDRDFNGTMKRVQTYRGAYAGEGTNPGWQLSNAEKVGGPSSGIVPPVPPQNLPNSK